ncbi:hypothetical protein JG687_00005773 [Phytophthora cactorum]|uniref:Uncharacterized protein n=1 Tax=Phytophthora cactorum TaxID=29920 RepID=A0A8T1UPR3_9STRA|nr:hypothetical protein JG687_00005773 [Phytophthora cactorum]
MGTTGTQYQNQQPSITTTWLWSRKRQRRPAQFSTSSVIPPKTFLAEWSRLPSGICHFPFLLLPRFRIRGETAGRHGLGGGGSRTFTRV